MVSLTRPGTVLGRGAAFERNLAVGQFEFENGYRCYCATTPSRTHTRNVNLRHGKGRHGFAHPLYLSTLLLQELLHLPTQVSVVTCY